MSYLAPFFLRTALVLALVTGNAGAAAILDVLTYNIQRAIGSTSSTTTLQPALAQVVNYLNPDVWTINELGGISTGFSRTAAYTYVDAFVASNLTIFGPSPQRGVNYFVYIGSYQDGYETNAIVSRYPILEGLSFSDAGGGYSALRGLTYAMIDVPGDTDVGFFTMHLKSSGETADAAKRQAETLANKTTISNWMSLHPTSGVIVTGDWNASRDSDDPSNWGSHKVGDPITLENGTVTPYDPVGTLLSAGLTDPKPTSVNGDKDTYSSTSPTKRYDYMAYGGANLVYTDGEVFNTASYSAAALAGMNSIAGTALTSSSSVNASDHLPVFATFAVIPEPGTVALLVIGFGFAAIAVRRRS